MTQDELTKLINEFLPYPSEGQHYALRQFAMIVADAEREACAKIAEDEEHHIAQWVARVIRLRGQS